MLDLLGFQRLGSQLVGWCDRQPGAGTPACCEPQQLCLSARYSNGEVSQKKSTYAPPNNSSGARHYEKPSTDHGDLRTFLLGGAYVAFFVVPRSGYRLLSVTHDLLPRCLLGHAIQAAPRRTACTAKLSSLKLNDPSKLKPPAIDNCQARPSECSYNTLECSSQSWGHACRCQKCKFVAFWSRSAL